MTSPHPTPPHVSSLLSAAATPAASSLAAGEPTPPRDGLTSRSSIAATTPPAYRATPANVGGGFSLQARIDRLQERCDALEGKAGYLRMLARLTDAKTAALALGVRT